jgi:hypothetical protein
MGKSEYGELPSYGGGQLLEEVYRRKLGSGVPEQLWLALAHVGVSPDLKAVALFALCRAESGEAQSMIYEALKSTNTIYIEKILAFRGLETSQPSYSWNVLRDSIGTWGNDLGLVVYGYTALAATTNASAHELLGKIARDANAPLANRVCAFSRYPDSSSSHKRVPSASLCWPKNALNAGSASGKGTTSRGREWDRL